MCVQRERERKRRSERERGEREPCERQQLYGNESHSCIPVAGNHYLKSAVIEKYISEVEFTIRTSADQLIATQNGEHILRACVQLRARMNGVAVAHFCCSQMANMRFDGIKIENVIPWVVCR